MRDESISDGEALEFGRSVCAMATRNRSLPVSVSEPDVADVDPAGVAFATMLVRNAVQRLCPWNAEWASEQLYFSSTIRYSDLMVKALARPS